jgi:hypothetical protein
MLLTYLSQIQRLVPPDGVELPVDFYQSTVSRRADGIPPIELSHCSSWFLGLLGDLRTVVRRLKGENSVLRHIPQMTLVLKAPLFLSTTGIAPDIGTLPGFWNL